MVRPRYQAGFSINSNDTLAHNVWTGSAPWNAAVIERYDADNDVRHRLGLLVNYELPWGRTMTSAARHFVGGWLVECHCGVADRCAVQHHQRGGTCEYWWSRSAQSRWQCGTRKAHHQPLRRHQCVPGTAVNTIGDQLVPRNLLHGPSQRRFDMSVFKDVPLQGAARLQLRMEIYNITNTPSFGNPNGQLGTAAFGTITNTVGTPRQMQFAAKLLF
jgi:hypothetical protein